MDCSGHYISLPAPLVIPSVEYCATFTYSATIVKLEHALLSHSCIGYFDQRSCCLAPGYIALRAAHLVP